MRHIDKFYSYLTPFLFNYIFNRKIGDWKSKQIFAMLLQLQTIKLIDKRFEQKKKRQVQLKINNQIFYFIFQTWLPFSEITYGKLTVHFHTNCYIATKLSINIMHHKLYTTKVSQLFPIYPPYLLSLFSILNYLPSCIKIVLQTEENFRLRIYVFLSRRTIRELRTEAKSAKYENARTVKRTRKVTNTNHT